MYIFIVFGRAGATPSSHTTGAIFYNIYIYIYTRWCVCVPHYRICVIFLFHFALQANIEPAQVQRSQIFTVNSSPLLLCLTPKALVFCHTNNTTLILHWLSRMLSLFILHQLLWMLSPTIVNVVTVCLTTFRNSDVPYALVWPGHMHVFTKAVKNSVLRCATFHWMTV